MHTSNCGAAARAVGMNPKTSTQLRVEWTSFRRAFEEARTPSHLALGTTVAFRKLLPEKTLTASPLGIPQVLLAAGLFVFKSRWTEVLLARARQTLCRFRRNCACDATANANRHAATFRCHQARRKPDRLGKGNAEGRPSSRNSYSHAAYPRQRASGTCMKQPSRLDIGSCTAESWYVCFPYRHLSWFAVRRSSICLLLCAACARPCQSALSPWRICKRFAQARPHSDSRMDFFVTL